MSDPLLASICRQLAVRMQHRVQAIEERDGADAITGPGVGISYLFAKELTDALMRAADELDAAPKEDSGGGTI